MGFGWFGDVWWVLGIGDPWGPQKLGRYWLVGPLEAEKTNIFGLGRKMPLTRPCGSIQGPRCLQLHLLRSDLKTHPYKLYICIYIVLYSCVHLGPTNKAVQSRAFFWLRTSSETGFRENSKEHVKAVSFVGGNAAGKHIYERAGPGK
jgi:hypothetical protein